MSAASPRTPRPGREFGARGGLGSAGDRAGGAARGWSGTPRGSSVAYPNISAGPSNFHRDTGCRSERPRRPVTLTLPLIAHARATGGGPECPVDFDPRYCYANSNEMSSGALVLATCPPPLPHPECGLQDTVGICLKGSRPASSLAGCATDRFGFFYPGVPYQGIFFARSCHRRWSGCFPDFCFRLARVNYLPHPECGFQDTCIGICTGIEGSRLTSSLTGSGKDGHRTNHEQREREQPGRFGARGSAGLAGVN